VKKAFLVTGGALVGLGILFVASVQYYHHHRFRSCALELAAAVNSGKSFEAFARDPRPDGLHRRFSQRERHDLRSLTSMWRTTPQGLADIDAKAARAHASAVFLFGDMVYVLFFDEEGRLREFVCLGN